MRGLLALTILLAIYFSKVHGKTLLVETGSKESESSEALNNGTVDDAPGDYTNLHSRFKDIKRIVRRLKAIWYWNIGIFNWFEFKFHSSKPGGRRYNPGHPLCGRLKRKEK